MIGVIAGLEEADLSILVLKWKDRGMGISNDAGSE